MLKGNLFFFFFFFFFFSPHQTGLMRKPPKHDRSLGLSSVYENPTPPFSRMTRRVTPSQSSIRHRVSLSR